ncbi:MAG: PQQ-like beta-propeller repeat protein [Candidatus Eisenbacteria bacterium]|nr:PQQ-like beta-propeller repeat protein [Candidatus Eisenbacteria bacterium]
MKRLILLILLAAAAWYGYKHYHELLDRRSGHDAVIENHTGREMQRVRLTADGKTYVKETIADESSAVIAFRVENDATFTLVWEYPDGSEHRWSGGMVPVGPMLQRHYLAVDGDDSVLYRAENKVLPAK